MDERDTTRILELVAASLGSDAKALRLAYHEIRDVREETRLKFNAPTPVTSYVVRLELLTRSGAKIQGEVELFHWVVDDEWELAASALL